MHKKFKNAILVIAQMNLFTAQMLLHSVIIRLQPQNGTSFSVNPGSCSKERRGMKPKVLHPAPKFILFSYMRRLILPQKPDLPPVLPHLPVPGTGHLPLLSSACPRPLHRS